MAYRTKLSWRYDTQRYAWKRARTETQQSGLAHVVFQTGDCFLVFPCEGMSDYQLSVIEDLLDGKFVRRTFVLK